MRRYCAAIANEGGGHLVLGVTNQRPREVVGTAAFSGPSSLHDLNRKLLVWLRLRIDGVEESIDGRRASGAGRARRSQWQ